MELQIKINLNCSNFDDQRGIEVARILRDVSEQMLLGFPWLGLKLRDVNGNVVGSLTIID